MKWNTQPRPPWSRSTRGRVMVTAKLPPVPWRYRRLMRLLYGGIQNGTLVLAGMRVLAGMHPTIWT